MDNISPNGNYQMEKEDLEEFADELTENEKLIFAYFDDGNPLCQ